MSRKKMLIDRVTRQYKIIDKCILLCWYVKLNVTTHSTERLK